MEHLLRHTAGWDETVGPVYDPMINSLLVGLGREVVDIAAEMKVTKGGFIKYRGRGGYDFEEESAILYMEFNGGHLFCS